MTTVKLTAGRNPLSGTVGSDAPGCFVRALAFVALSLAALVIVGLVAYVVLW